MKNGMSTQIKFISPPCGVQGKFTNVRRHQSTLLLQTTIVKVSWIWCVYQPPFQINCSEHRSYIFLGRNGKTKINTVFCCLQKLWKNGSWFLISRVRELHVLPLIRVIGEFPCVCWFIPFIFAIFDARSSGTNIKKKSEVENGSGEKGKFYCLINKEKWCPFLSALAHNGLANWPACCCVSDWAHPTQVFM